MLHFTLELTTSWPRQLVQRERFAVPRIHGLDTEIAQFPDALIRLGQVVCVVVERGPHHVYEQVPAEQVAVVGENTDRSAGMTRQMHDPRVEPVGREVLSVLEEYIRLEGLEVHSGVGEPVQ